MRNSATAIIIVTILSTLPAHAGFLVMTFDGGTPAQQPNNIGFLDYTESGIVATAIDSSRDGFVHFDKADFGLDGDPDSEMALHTIQHDASFVRFELVSGDPFNPISVDLENVTDGPLNVIFTNSNGVPSDFTVNSLGTVSLDTRDPNWMNIDWFDIILPVDADQWVSIDNVTVTPEPSIGFLLSDGALGLLTHQRKMYFYPAY